MGTVAEVRIARRTGFCYGVREAIDAARISASEGKKTHTLGQVVHNEGVISELKAQGIVSVGELDEVDEGAAVVIRAHGVTPEVMGRAQDKGLDVIDGTCSWVTQEQKELARLVDDGYTIVLLGTPNHPEVVGLLGYAPDAILVDEEEDWHKIPRKKRMALLTQSTQPPWKFERLAGYLTTRAHELKIVNTVCPVTIRRQEDTTDLAESVDLVVVVGGRNSANTRELTRLVGIVGKPADPGRARRRSRRRIGLRWSPTGRRHRWNLHPHRGSGGGSGADLRAGRDGERTGPGRGTGSQCRDRRG